MCKQRLPPPDDSWKEKQADIFPGRLHVIHMELRALHTFRAWDSSFIEISWGPNDISMNFWVGAAAGGEEGVLGKAWLLPILCLMLADIDIKWCCLCEVTPWSLWTSQMVSFQWNYKGSNFPCNSLSLAVSLLLLLGDRKREDNKSNKSTASALCEGKNTSQKSPTGTSC